jgi:hypothetical protein
MPLLEAKAGRVPPVSSTNSRGHEVRVWALMALLGVASLIAGCILWARISGF